MLWWSVCGSSTSPPIWQYGTTQGWCLAHYWQSSFLPLCGTCWWHDGWRGALSTTHNITCYHNPHLTIIYCPLKVSTKYKLSSNNYLCRLMWWMLWDHQQEGGHTMWVGRRGARVQMPPGICYWMGQCSGCAHWADPAMYILNLHPTISFHQSVSLIIAVCFDNQKLMIQSSS